MSDKAEVRVVGTCVPFELIHYDVDSVLGNRVSNTGSQYFLFYTLLYVN